MKRFVVSFLLAFVLLLGACGNESGHAVTPTTVSEQPKAPTATPTPDFSGTDFSGHWYVFELIDSNGMPVTEAELQNLGAGFTLELLPSGTYFVYHQDGKVLGQGTYSVALNQLILSANGTDTVYEIADADTLRMTQPDTSITVMKKKADDEGDDIQPEINEGDIIEGSADDQQNSTPPAEAPEENSATADDSSSDAAPTTVE